MPVFSYVARNAQGQIIRGSEEAENAEILRRMLKERGYWVTQIKQEKEAAAAAPKKAAGPKFVFGRIKLAHLAMFCRQLATLINAGVSLVRALSVLEKQTPSPRLAQIIHEVAQKVQEGMSFSRALADYPKVFSNLFVGLVRAGEVGGVLDETLDRMATFLEKDLELRRKVKSAMTYPTIVTIFAIGVVVFLCTFVVPKFMKLFEELELKPEEFPIVTRMLKAFSDFLLTKWWMVLIGVALFAIAFLNYIRTRTGKKQYDWLKLHVPILGPINHMVALARFARTFGTLINSGVPILQAMDTCAEAIGNDIVAKAIMDARMAVREGSRIADPLENSKLFPPMVVHMIAVGEETGSLDQMLQKIADFYEGEVDARLESLAATIEPVLIVLLGGVVLFIILSVFMPLITIINKLSGEGGEGEGGSE